LAEPEPADAEPLLPIARALKEAVDARLVAEPGVSIDVDRAWDEAIHQVATRLITAELEKMDPIQVLALYANRVGDEELKETLGRWAARRTEELEQDERRARLRRNLESSGSVELGTFDANARLRLSMFDSGQIREARRDGSLPPSRTVELRLVDPERGYADVVSDTTLSMSRPESFPVHCRGSFGSTILEHGEPRLEPRLQVHAPLGYDVGLGPENTPQIIGFIDLI
jgi:hypothetical protein